MDSKLDNLTEIQKALVTHPVFVRGACTGAELVYCLENHEVLWVRTPDIFSKAHDAIGTLIGTTPCEGSCMRGDLDSMPTDAQVVEKKTLSESLVCFHPDHRIRISGWPDWLCQGIIQLLDEDESLIPTF